MNRTGNATKMFYSAERSYGDISAATMFQDMDMVFIGAALMFIYMEIVLSRFGWTEFRVCSFCKLFGPNFCNGQNSKYLEVNNCT